MKNGKCKIIWDFTVQADLEIYGARPDIIVVQKDKNLCQITDFACPYDRRELRKIWNIKVKVIPLVIRALGTAPIKFRSWLKEIGIENQITELHNTVLLHTTQILQKVFEV